jgi:hypothetical protein
MNPEFPEIGGLVTAGLAAKEIDAVSVANRQGGETGSHHSCLNCGAPLSANYCGTCGQPAHLHRSLWHLSEQFLEGVLHFDAKGFRTAPLLVFRPGLLTRRYIDGQRTRYVSPMALFLFCIFLMYFVFSIAAEDASPHNNIKVEDASAARAELAKAQQEVDDEVAKDSANLARLTKLGADTSDAQKELSAAILSQKALATSRMFAGAALDLATPQPTPAPQTAAPASTTPASTTPASTTPASVTPASTTPAAEAADKAIVLAPGSNWKEQLAAQARPHVNDPGRKGKIFRALANPDLALYKLKSTAYKLSFMLIPISLPFLWLMFFWRRGVAMYDHAIFALYSLSFMSLLFTAATLLAMAGAGDLVAACVVFIPPVHMFAQLRGTYALGVFAALWRTVALLCICGTVFVLFLAFVVAMTLH